MGPGSSFPPSAFALVVAVLALIPFARTLGHGFVWDDFANVVANRWIRDPSHVATILGSPLSGFDPQFVNSYYRPVMHLAYMATRLLTGPGPAGFHAMNVVLHVAASVLVFLTIRALLRSGVEGRSPDLPSFLGAAVFATHPVHTEAVAWIGGITDLTYSLFGLLCIRAYATARRPPAYLSSGGFLLLALLSKEPAAAIPGLLILLELLRGAERPGGLLRRFAPIGAAAAVYLLMRVRALGGLAPHANREGFELLPSVLGGFELLARYVRYLVFPSPLSASHAYAPPQTLLEPATVLSIAGVAALLVGILAARRSPALSLGLAWIVLPLLPALWIPALGDGIFAERYLYFPSAGFALVLAVLAKRLLARGPTARVAVILATAVVSIVFGAAALSRCRVWHDSVALWSDAAAKSPGSAPAQEYLCSALYAAGRVDEAADRCLEAIRLDGSRVDARINLGNALAVRGDLAGALASLDEALRRRPTSVEAWTSRGLVRMAQGAPDDALACYARALEIDPGNAEAHNVLGVAHARLGRPDDARRELREAVRLAPEREEYRRNLRALDGPS